MVLLFLVLFLIFPTNLLCDCFRSSSVRDVMQITKNSVWLLVDWSLVPKPETDQKTPLRHYVQTRTSSHSSGTATRIAIPFLLKSSSSLTTLRYASNNRKSFAVGVGTYNASIQIDLLLWTANNSDISPILDLISYWWIVNRKNSARSK